MIRINPLLAAEAAAQFRYVIARGCGMSSGLALAAAKRDLVPKLLKGEKILILFSDDAGRYGPQLKKVAYAATP
jgi:cysteine synthase